MPFRQKGRKSYQYFFRYKRKKYYGCLGTRNKGGAKFKEAEIKSQVKKGGYFDGLPGEKKRFSEMMERFILEHGPNVSERTRKFYGYARKPLVKVLGDMIVSDISSKDVVEYKSLRRMDGVSGSTINNELKVLSKAFNLAFKEWEWIRENPISKVSREKEGSPRDRWLTREEAIKLLSFCEFPIKELVIFALNTGMRQDEIFSLSWKDVNRANNTIIIRETKNGKPRTLPLTGGALEVLQKMDKVRKLRSNLVFPNMVGNKLVRQRVHEKFKKALGLAKIEDFTFHDLRHTCATWLAQDGQDIYLIQRWLGHLDPRMTRRYAHHSAESLRRGVKSLKIQTC